MGVQLVSRPSAVVDAVVAAAAPDLPPDRAELLVRYCRWSIALDDRIDGSRMCPTASALTAELAAIMARFRVIEPRGELLARFRTALSDAVSAGTAQLRLGHAIAAGDCRPPSAEAFLALAGRSVNYRSFAWALLLLLDERPDEPAARRIEAALDPGSRAVRLANDLRTFDRDRGERGLNVLMLRAQDGSPVDPAWVEREIAVQIRRHHALLGPHVATGAGLALARALRAAVEAYAISDIR